MKLLTVFSIGLAGLLFTCTSLETSQPSCQESINAWVSTNRAFGEPDIQRLPDGGFILGFNNETEQAARLFVLTALLKDQIAQALPTLSPFTQCEEKEHKFWITTGTILLEKR